MEALSWDIFLITMDIYGKYLKLVFMYSHGAYLKKKLVGGIPTPLKNMSSSVGMMTFPINMESQKKHAPNHQPDIYFINHH